jgi:hypothetical protein
MGEWVLGMVLALTLAHASTSVRANQRVDV